MLLKIRFSLLTQSLLAVELLLSTLAYGQAPTAQPTERRRVLVLSDIEADPDDSQSLVWFLTYANQWDVEGLIATTSIHQKTRVAPETIHQIVDAYGKVQPNLLKHELGYLTAQALKAVIKKGLPVYGMAGVGEGHDSEGSIRKDTLCLSITGSVSAQMPTFDKSRLGVAYYDEYIPYERLDKDIQMMKEAGINVVRIAESTWSTVEPQDGVFDFSHIDRVLNAMHKAGIGVIIGTPTYAVPTWLVRKYPDVLATTPQGQNRYGPRQNMDIANEHFRFHAERVIRRIMEHVKPHPAVIGYQVDNETKHYSTTGANVQRLFVQYMRDKYKTLDAINKAYGLDYWSNRINNWDDFPSTVGTINASLGAEFAKFQRQLVTDYLAWQVGLVNEYKRSGQFVMQNFDFEWRGYSYGIQPDVDHFAAAKMMDFAGVDIYHPTQSQLTGIEISSVWQRSGNIHRLFNKPSRPAKNPGRRREKSGCVGPDQQLSFPLITKSGVNQQGKTIHYYFNYSSTPASLPYPHKAGQELLSNGSVTPNAPMRLEPWGVKIVEENK